MLNLNDLNKPFSYSEYSVNFDGQVYVSQQSMVDRLNEVVGHFNWEFEPLQIDVNMSSQSVSCLGELRIWDEERQRWIFRRQYGNDTMTVKKGRSNPDGQAIEDAKKSAVSDSLKKCASWFGTASDVYKGIIKCIPVSDKQLYWGLVNGKAKELGLSPSHFKNGVVTLPNAYKAVIQNGIFESDILALQPQQQVQQTQTKPATHPQPKHNQKHGAIPPTEHRIKVTSTFAMNPDGSSSFSAMLEDGTAIKCFVPKELVPNAVQPDRIFIVSGWFNERSKVLRIDKKSTFQLDSPRVA